MSDLTAQKHLGTHASALAQGESHSELDVALSQKFHEQVDAPMNPSDAAPKPSSLAPSDAEALVKITGPAALAKTNSIIPSFDSQSNPAAHGLFSLLEKAGVNPKALDKDPEDEGSGKISVQEVFGYIGANLSDPKVQQVLKALDLKLTTADKKIIVKKGFANFMAERFAAEAKELKKSATGTEGIGQQDEIARLLMFTTFFEPENHARFLELAGFFSEVQAYPAAIQAYASALELNEGDQEIQKKMLAVYDLALMESFETASQLKFAGDLNGAITALQDMVSTYEFAAKILPDKFQGGEKISEVGDLYFQLGEFLKEAGKTDLGHQAFGNAVKFYQAWITTNQTNPKCIKYYKQMGHAYHEMGNYQGAAKSYMLASQCKKLIIHFNPEDPEQQLPDINSLKHDRAPSAYVGVEAPTGNYIPSEVHQIEFADAGTVDALPDWANFNIGYFNKLNELLKSNAQEREHLAATQNPDTMKRYDLLVAEVKILNFLSRPEEAAQRAQEAAKLKDQATIERLTKEVSALDQAGFIDTKNFETVSTTENDKAETKFFHTNFVDFEKVPQGKNPTFQFNDDYQNLPAAKKIRVLHTLIRSAERTKLDRMVLKAKGSTQLFFAAQLALFDGDTAEAKVKLAKFQEQAASSKDPKTKTLLEKTELTLQALNNGKQGGPKKITQDLMALLGPLVMATHQDSQGRLSFEHTDKNELADLAAFKKYLATQVSVDGVSFNQVWMASYEKVVQDPQFDGLMKCLYAEFTGEPYPEQDIDCLHLALIKFQQELANVSFGKFVGAQMDSEAGRERLKAILVDEHHYSVGFKANILEEIIDVGERQGFVPQHLRNLFEQQLNTYLPDSMSDLRQMVPKPLENFYDRSVTLVGLSGNSGISERELRLATKYGLKILQLGEAQKAELDQQIEKYHQYAQEVQRLNHGKLNSEVTAQDIKDMAALIKEKQRATDEFSVLQVRVAKLWLLVIDDKNWSTQHTTHFVSREQRAHMVNQLEVFFQEAKTVQSNEDFLRLSKRVRRFLRGQGEGKGDDWVEQGGDTAKRAIGSLLGNQAGKKLGGYLEETAEMGMELVGGEVDEHFEGMTPAVAAGYQDLLRFTDEIWAADNMGMALDVQDPPLKLTDSAKQKKATELIQQLRQIKRGLWYNYKQRNMLSRGLSSNLGDQELIGDTAEIRLGIKEIDGIIADIQNAASNEDLEKIKGRLTKATQAEGALHLAYQAAEMDGWEQAVNLAETIGEILIISALTRGVATEGALVRGVAALRRTANLRKTYRGFRIWLQARKLSQAKQAKNALEASKAIQSLGAEFKNYRSLSAKIAQALEGEIGFTAKAAQGFKMGTGIVLTMNFGGMLTGQLKATPTDILDILKECLATGGAMAISAGLAPEAALTPEAMAKARENILKYCWTRYTAQGARGALTFMADTGLEVVEEVADAYILKFLNGDYSKLSWDELKDIIIVCVGGGGMKMGALKKFIDQGRQIYQGRNGQAASETDTEATSKDGIPATDPIALPTPLIPPAHAIDFKKADLPQPSVPGLSITLPVKNLPGNDNAIPKQTHETVAGPPKNSPATQWAAAAAAGVAVSLEAIPDAMAHTATALSSSPQNGLGIAAGMATFFVGMALSRKKSRGNSDRKNIQAFLDLAVDWGHLMEMADEDSDLEFIEEVKEDILRNTPRSDEVDFSKKLRALENIIEFFIEPALHAEAYRDLVFALAKSGRFDVAEKLILKGKLAVKNIPAHAEVDGHAFEIIARVRMAQSAFEQGRSDGEANPLFQLAMLDPDLWHQPLSVYLNHLAKAGKLAQATPLFHDYANALDPRIIPPQLIEDMHFTLIQVQMDLTGAATGKLFGKIFDPRLFSTTILGLGAGLATLLTPKIADAAVDAAVAASQGLGGIYATAFAAIAGGLLGMAIGKDKDKKPLSDFDESIVVVELGKSGESKNFQDSQSNSQQHSKEDTPAPPQIGKRLVVDEVTLDRMERFPARIIQQHQDSELNPVFFGLNHLKWWMGLVRRDVGEWGALAMVEGGKILFGRWQEDPSRQASVEQQLEMMARQSQISQQLVMPTEEAWFRPLWEQAVLLSRQGPKKVSTETQGLSNRQLLAAILQQVGRHHPELAEAWLLELAEQDADLSVAVEELREGAGVRVQATVELSFQENLAGFSERVQAEAWEEANHHLAELYGAAWQQASLEQTFHGILELRALLEDLEGKMLPSINLAKSSLGPLGENGLGISTPLPLLNPLLMEWEPFSQQVKDNISVLKQNIPTGFGPQDKAQLFNYLGYIFQQLGSHEEANKYFKEAHQSILTMTVLGGYNHQEQKDIIQLIISTQNGIHPPFPALQPGNLETKLNGILSWKEGIEIVRIQNIPLIKAQALAYLTQMFHAQAHEQNTRAPLSPQVVLKITQTLEEIQKHWGGQAVELHIGKSIMNGAALGFLYLKLGHSDLAKGHFDQVDHDMAQFPPNYFFAPSSSPKSPEENFAEFGQKLALLKQGIWSFGDPSEQNWPWADSVPIDGLNQVTHAATEIKAGRLSKAIKMIGKGFGANGGWDAEFSIAYLVHVLTEGAVQGLGQGINPMGPDKPFIWKSRVLDLAKRLGSPGQGLKLPGGNANNRAALAWCYLAVALRKVGDVAGSQEFFIEADRANQYAAVGNSDLQIQRATAAEIEKSKMHLWSLEIDQLPLTKVQALCQQGHFEPAFHEIELLHGEIQAKALALFAHEYGVYQPRANPLIALPPGAILIPQNGIMTVGRAPDNHLVVQHHQVSAKHAQIQIEKKLGGFEIKIKDLHSTNGTHVQGRRVTPHSEFTVDPGTMIGLGPFPFKISMPADPSSLQDAHLALVPETNQTEWVIRGFPKTPQMAPSPALEPVLQMPTPTPTPPPNLHPDAVPLPIGKTLKLGRRRSSDLVFTDEKISKDHLQLEIIRRQPTGNEQDALAVGILDQNSSNGTYYAGQKLPTQTPVIIRTGGSFRIGAIDISILLDPSHGNNPFIAWEPGAQENTFVIKSYPATMKLAAKPSPSVVAGLLAVKSKLNAWAFSLEPEITKIDHFFNQQLNLAVLGSLLKKLGHPRGQTIIDRVRPAIQGEALSKLEIEMIEEHLQGKLDATAFALSSQDIYHSIKDFCQKGHWDQALDLIQKQNHTDQAFFLAHFVEFLWELHGNTFQLFQLQDYIHKAIDALKTLLEEHSQNDWGASFKNNPQGAYVDFVNNLSDLTVLEFYYELKGMPSEAGQVKQKILRETETLFSLTFAHSNIPPDFKENIDRILELQRDHDYSFSEGMFHWEAGELKHRIQEENWASVFDQLDENWHAQNENISHFIGEILAAAKEAGKLDLLLQLAAAEVIPSQQPRSETEPPRPHRNYFEALPTRELSLVPEKYRHLIPKPQDIVLFPRFEKILNETASLVSAPDRIAIRFFGPPGTGKTTFPEMIAQKMGIPLLRFPFSRRTDPSDLEGLWTREKVSVEIDGESREELVPVFKEGAPTIALEHGFHLVLDEPDLARAGVLAYINNISAPGEFAWVRKDNGSLKKIRVHPDFRVYATENGVAEVAREEHGKDFLRRFVAYHVAPWSQEEVEQVLTDSFENLGGIKRWPKKLTQTLAYFHDKMRLLAEGLEDPETRQRLPHLGHDVGQQIEFTPRSILRLAQRLVASGPLSPESLSKAIRSEYILPLADADDRDLVWAQAEAIFDPVALALGWIAPADSQNASASKPRLGAHLISKPTLASISQNYLAGRSISQGGFVWTDQALRLADEILWNRSLGIDVMLLGEAGEGKTELPPQIAKLLQLNYYQKTVSSETDEEDLVGGLGRTNGKIEFIPDIVTLGTAKGGLIHLDEYLLSDTGKLESVMNPLMDATKALILKNPFRMVPRNPDTFILLTSNPPFGDYQDRNEHSGAAMSRVAVIFLADEFGMGPKDRKQILRHWADEPMTLQGKRGDKEVKKKTGPEVANSPAVTTSHEEGFAALEDRPTRPEDSPSHEGTRDFLHPLHRFSMTNQKAKQSGPLPLLTIHPEVQAKYHLPASLEVKFHKDTKAPEVYECHADGTRILLQSKTKRALGRYANYLTRRTKVDMGLIGHRVFEILYTEAGNHSTDLKNKRIILNIQDLLGRPIAAALGAGKHEWAHAEIDRPHEKYDAHEPGRLFANVVGDPRMNEYAASLRQDFSAQIEALYQGVWPKEISQQEIELYLERVLPHEQFADAIIHFWRHGEIMPWIEDEKVLKALREALPILTPAFTLFPKSTKDHDVEIAAAQFYEILDRAYPYYESLFSDSLKNLAKRLEAGATPQELIQEILEMLGMRLPKAGPPNPDQDRNEDSNQEQQQEQDQGQDQVRPTPGDSVPQNMEAPSSDTSTSGSETTGPIVDLDEESVPSQRSPKNPTQDPDNSPSDESSVPSEPKVLVETPQKYDAEALQKLAQQILNQRAEQMADQFEPKDPGRFEKRKEQIAQAQNAGQNKDVSPLDDEHSPNSQEKPSNETADSSLNQDELRNMDAERQRLIQERLQNDLFSRMVSPQAMQMAKRLKRFVPPDNPAYLEGYFTTGKRLSRKKAAQEAMNPMSDGKVMLRRLRPGDRNANIVILSDVSKSMVYAGAVENTLRGSADAIYLSEELKVNYGEIVFQGDLRVAKPLGKPLNNRRKKNELLNLKEQAYRDGSLRSGTNLREPLAMAMDWIQNKKAKANYIILITDGEETERNYPKTLAQLQQEAAEAGISILVLAMGRAHHGLNQYFDHVEAVAPDGSNIAEKIIELFAKAHQDRLKPSVGAPQAIGKNRRGLLGGGGSLGMAAVGAGLASLLSPSVANAAIDGGALLSHHPAASLLTGIGSLLMASVLTKAWASLKEAFLGEGYPTPRFDELDNSLGAVKRNSVSFSYSMSGTERVILKEAMTIAGIHLPKDSWLTLHYDNREFSYLAPTYQTADGLNLPTDTLVTFDQEGYIKSIALPRTHWIQQIPCSSSHQGHVHFYANGQLKQAVLGRDFEIQGIPFHRGSVIHLDENGELEAVTLSQEQDIEDITFEAGSQIKFNIHNRLHGIGVPALLGLDTLLHGEPTVAGLILTGLASASVAMSFIKPGPKKNTGHPYRLKQEAAAEQIVMAKKTILDKRATITDRVLAIQELVTLGNLPLVAERELQESLFFLLKTCENPPVSKIKARLQEYQTPDTDERILRTYAMGAAVELLKKISMDEALVKKAKPVVIRIARGIELSSRFDLEEIGNWSKLDTRYSELNLTYRSQPAPIWTELNFDAPYLNKTLEAAGLLGIHDEIPQEVWSAAKWLKFLGQRFLKKTQNLLGIESTAMESPGIERMTAGAAMGGVMMSGVGLLVAGAGIIPVFAALSGSFVVGIIAGLLWARFGNTYRDKKKASHQKYLKEHQEEIKKQSQQGALYPSPRLKEVTLKHLNFNNMMSIPGATSQRRRQTQVPPEVNMESNLRINEEVTPHPPARIHSEEDNTEQLTAEESLAHEEQEGVNQHSKINKP